MSASRWSEKTQNQTRKEKLAAPAKVISINAPILPEWDFLMQFNATPTTIDSDTCKNA